MRHVGRTPRAGRIGGMGAGLVLAGLAVGCTAVLGAEGRGPSVVKVAKADGGYRLLRDGSPYFIKGAGGDGSMEALARAGGNSVRTWGADKAGQVLDEAQRRG